MTSANGKTLKQAPNYKILALWYGISAVIVVLDLWTKSLATDAMVLYERINILPIFDLTLRHNYGAAFSFLAGESGWQVWFFGIIAGVVSIGITVWLFVVGRQKTLEALGLALILGGALGNLYDRATLGYVVDFILFYYQDAQFPAFNIADSAITGGVGVLLLDAFRKTVEEKKSAKTKASGS